MTVIAVVPGSFDPVTLGHLDVIVRASGLFDEVHVLVVHNPAKKALIPVEKRVELIETAVAEAARIDSAAIDAALIQNVVVTSWSEGLLVDYCTRVGAKVLVKGIRSQVDVGYETPMAIMNRSLAGVETIFMLPDPAHALVSSSLVRQVAGLGGDVSPYVPGDVAAYLQTPTTTATNRRA